MQNFVKQIELSKLIFAIQGFRRILLSKIQQNSRNISKYDTNLHILQKFAHHGQSPLAVV